MDLTIGDIFTELEVVNFVKNIHYNNIDFIEGNLRENIEKYDKYELKEVYVKGIEDPCYYIDDLLIEDYMNMDISNTPPIVLGYYEDGSYLTIDGGHRVFVYKKKNILMIKAFVAIK